MTGRGTALAVVGAVAVTGCLPLLAVVGSAPLSGGLARPWSGAVVAAPGPDLPDEPAAVRALDRAARAARSVSYTGLAAIQQWGADGGTARLLEVVRVPGRGTLVRVRGAAGTVESSRLTADAGAPTASPADSGRVLGLLARNFAVTVGGRDQVAGRCTDVVVARRADGRAAARFWLDRESGLVLRREVYDAAGRTAQAATFLRLRLAGPGGAAVAGRPADEIAAALTADPAGSAAPWTTPADRTELTGLRARGWACPQALPQGLVLFDVRRGSTPDGDVLQLVYSDGLATVSLFEQRGRLAPDGPPGFVATDVAGTRAWTRAGLPTQVVWESDGSVLTLVADAPADLVAAVVAALPGTGAQPDGWLDRVARGWARLVDAVRPGA